MAGQVLVAIMAGLTYGLSHYVKKVQKGEGFDPYKLAATEVVAVFVAVSLALSGVRVDQLTIGQQFVLYAGTIPIVENIIKAVVRAYRRTEEPPKHPEAPAKG